MAFTFAQCLMIEGNAEDAFMRILETAIPVNPVSNQRAIFQSRTPRIAETPSLEIKVIAGEIFKNHQKIFQNQVYQEYDAFNGELQVTIKTNRTTDTTMPTHAQLLGEVRARLNLSVMQQVTWQSPLLIIVDCRGQGTVQSVEDENNLDISVLSFFLVLQVKPDAWPTNPIPL